MKAKALQISQEGQKLKVDLTLHNLPVDLLEQFALAVAQPYYGGNVAAAVRDLIQRAVAEQEFVDRHVHPE